MSVLRSSASGAEQTDPAVRVPPHALLLAAVPEGALVGRAREGLRGDRAHWRSWTARAAFPRHQPIFHPNAAPIFSSENVLIRFRGFHEPRWTGGHNKACEGIARTGVLGPRGRRFPNISQSSTLTPHRVSLPRTCSYALGVFTNPRAGTTQS